MRSSNYGLNRQREYRLVRAVQESGASASWAFDELRSAFTPLIQRCACIVPRSLCDPDDVLQELSIVFWQVINDFDFRRGVRLASYAIPHLEGKARDQIRVATKLREHEIPETETAAKTLTEPTSGLRDAEPEHIADRMFASQVARSLVSRVSPSIRKVIALRHCRGLSGADTARTLGVSRAHVSQCERKVMEIGREIIEELGVAA